MFDAVSLLPTEIMLSYFYHFNYSTGCPQKKSARRLIRCKLKMTVFTRSTFIFSESSYFNVKFGIQQSKID